MVPFLPDLIIALVTVTIYKSRKRRAHLRLVELYKAISEGVWVRKVDKLMGKRLPEQIAASVVVPKENTGN